MTDATSTNDRKIRILLTGASGYLGQHLLSYWMTNGPFNRDDETLAYEVVALVNTSKGLDEAITRAEATTHSNVSIEVQTCDLTSESQLKTLFENESTGFDLCIHTAALSSPRACENDPAAAEALNCPKLLFDSLTARQTPLIALSTDQVYNGRKNVPQDGCYQEDIDRTDPLNIYGRTKVQMEDYLKETRTSGDGKQYPPTIVLRSSIILGPLAPLVPEAAHSTFLHFCQSRSKEETTFFVNEYRTVVSVGHVCRSLAWMAHYLTSPSRQNSVPSHPYRLFNLGGPVRVNRYEMAKAVFAKFGFDSKYLLEAQQISTMSPLDISMDSSKLERWTGIAHEPSTLAGIVEVSFPSTKVVGLV